MGVCLLVQVVAVVSELQRREASLKGLPLYAVGASSGGAFALTITAYLRFSGETMGLCPPMCLPCCNTNTTSSCFTLQASFCQLVGPGPSPLPSAYKASVDAACVSRSAATTWPLLVTPHSDECVPVLP
jgi:hypothetical protein